MYGREALVVPQLLQGREARVEAEVPVQVDHLVGRYGDARTLGVIRGFAMRHDHVQPIDRAALEQAHQNRMGGWADGPSGRKSRARQEQRIHTQADEGQPAGLYEDTSRDCHCFWKSGPPKASPIAMILACVESLMSFSCSRITVRVCADIVPASSF